MYKCKRCGKPVEQAIEGELICSACWNNQQKSQKELAEDAQIEHFLNHCTDCGKKLITATEKHSNYCRSCWQQMADDHHYSESIEPDEDMPPYEIVEEVPDPPHYGQNSGGRIYLVSLQDLRKHKVDEAFMCTVWPPKDGKLKNEALFAPTAYLVGGHKNYASAGKDPRFAKYKPVNDEEYTKLYRQILDERLPKIRKWCEENADRTVALCCYCSFTKAFCHLDVLEMWFWDTFGKTVKVERKH